MVNSSAQRFIRLETRRPMADLDVDSFTQQVIQDRIGRQLRDMYSDLMQQPIPDQLVSLLSRLVQDESQDNAQGNALDRTGGRA